jgi:DNA recombination protein RmuC
MVDLLLFGGGLAVGAAILAGATVWLVARSNLRSAKSELEKVKAERDAAQASNLSARESLAAANQKAGQTEVLERQAADLRDQLLAAEGERARIEERLRNAEALANSQQDQFQALIAQTKTEFQSIASEVVQGNAKTFLENAALTLNPFSETFGRYETLLRQMENERQNVFGGITSELNAVRQQLDTGQIITTRLVNALRAAPKTRGRWGEQSLQRVMELAQMIPYCDFEMEKSYRKLDELLRPDAVIHLAGDRHIIVDAKAPISAFLDAAEAETEEQREMHLVRHAKQLRERMESLCHRSYWEKLEGTPDCVVMFVPGDNFFSAAVERDLALFDDAISKRVLIATPTTFIALAKAIAYGWRQQKLAESAIQISQMGRELYQRMSVMGAHLVSMGSNLKRSVEDYNRFVGSLEGSVMPQARKFHELGVDGATKPIPAIEPVESEVRDLKPGRDILIEPQPQPLALDEKS